jgi:FtsZ-interacting cell division protein ZipA
MDVLVVVVALVALVGGLWSIRHERETVATLRRDLEIEQEWCAYWQKRAMDGDDQIEALSTRNETLQALYAERTQQALAKNSYLIGAYGKAKN